MLLITYPPVNINHKLSDCDIKLPPLTVQDNINDTIQLDDY